MDLLDKELSQLRPSTPVFKIKLDTHWNGESKNIKFTPCGGGSYKGNENTPIGKLVNRYFSENFNGGWFRIDKDSIKQRCINSIREDILYFLTNHSTQKNPTKTVMFRWFEKAAFTKYNENFLSACINLFVYIKNKGATIHEPPCESGILSAIGMLYNKHKDDFPTEYTNALEPRRRRRRRW